LHPVVSQLLSLQKVDQKVAKFQKKLDAIPEEVRRRRAKLDRLEREAKEVAAKVEAAELKIRDLESQVNSIDAAIKKQEGHRDAAQNASTYAAAQHQIEYLKGDKEKLQAEEFESIEQLEELQPRQAELAEELAKERSEFAEFDGEIRKLEAELTSQRDEVAKEREAYLHDVPPENLTDYESLLRRREGQAVVPVEGEFCSGCYTRVTTNDMARLQGGTTLVICTSCARILYIP